MIMKRKSSRSILPYFIDSKVWQAYLEGFLLNTTYWKAEDHSLYLRMVEANKQGKLGLIVEDYVYGMLHCTHVSNLKPLTKKRIYDEVSVLEEYHITNDTLKEEL